MRDRRLQQRVTLVLGILLTFAMLSSTAIGLLRNVGQQTAQTTPPPTATLRPTVPAPIEDLSTIQFDQTYVHPTGLFTAAIPGGWSTTNEFSTENEAQVTMRNPSALSVIEIRVTRPTEEHDVSTGEGISAIFDDSWLRSSWREYTSWDESSRTVEDDRVVIDFNLMRTGQRYIARQESFSDGTWVYSVRVITPPNASRVLQYVLENEVDSFQTVERFVGEPLDWNAFFDPDNNHVIRFPDTWSVADSAPGAPTSISSPNADLRVEVLDRAIDTEDAASAYVEGLRSGITVQSVEAVEQFGTPGYRVAYTLATPDGATRSGLVVLLRDAETTHSANVLLKNVSDTDLNAVDVSADDTPAAVANALDLLSTFSLASDLQLAANPDDDSE